MKKNKIGVNVPQGKSKRVQRVKGQGDGRTICRHWADACG